MNVKRLQEAIESLKESLGGALIATDIWSTNDAQPIIGFNSQPQACALFNQITQLMSKALKSSNFPAIGRYYLLDLSDHKTVVVIPLENFNWGILVDTTKAPLGLLLNVALPQAVTIFQEAVAN
jgi:hypothetical protein